MLGRGLESLIPAGGANQSNNGQPLTQGGQALPQAPKILPQETGESVGVSLAGTQAPVFLSINEEKTKDKGTAIDSEVKLPAVNIHASSDSIFGERNDAFKSFQSRPIQEAIFQLEVNLIEPNPFQPRKDFNEEELRELAQSIREYGIIQPLIVSKIEEETDGGTMVRYQLIAGERRLRAAKLVGLERVPAIVRKIDTKKLNLELAIIENVQRADLNPLDEAKAYARLQDEFNLTQREIAMRMGKSRESVANTLRLLSLPSFIQEALLEGKVNESQARVLLSVSNLQDQKRMFAQLIEDKMSVRQLKRKVSGVPDPEKNYLERQLEEKL